MLTTSSFVRASLDWSGPFSILGQLQQLYSVIIGPAAEDDPIVLSTAIVQVIALANTLNGLIQSLPVAPANIQSLGVLQQRMLLAIRILNSLAIPPNALSFS